MTEVKWKKIKDFSEIIFERTGKIAKITMNRPEKHNAFTPVTVAEMIEAFTICRDDSSIGVIILTGAGDQAFSSGGDQSVRQRWLRRPRPHCPAKCLRLATSHSYYTKTSHCDGERLVCWGWQHLAVGL